MQWQNNQSKADMSYEEAFSAQGKKSVDSSHAT